MMKVKFEEEEKKSPKKKTAKKQEEVRPSARKSNTKFEVYKESDQTLLEIEQEKAEEEEAKRLDDESAASTKFNKVKSDATKKRLSMSAKTSKSRSKEEDDDELSQKEQEGFKSQDSKIEETFDEPEEKIHTSQVSEAKAEEEKKDLVIQVAPSSQDSTKAVQGSVVHNKLTTDSLLEGSMAESQDYKTIKVSQVKLQADEEEEELKRTPQFMQKMHTSQPEEHKEAEKDSEKTSGSGEPSPNPTSFIFQEERKSEEEKKETELNKPWIGPEEAKEDRRKSAMLQKRLTEAAERVASSSPDRTASKALLSKKKEQNSKHRHLRNSNAKLV